MEFEITCPIDGQVQVSLEDIETVVLREPERADITFVCPHCGTEITVSAVVPSFLLAALEALAEEGDTTGPVEDIITVLPAESVERATLLDDPRADAYCEYFRRQLSHIDSVDDVLHEIDAKG